MLSAHLTVADSNHPQNGGKAVAAKRTKAAGRPRGVYQATALWLTMPLAAFLIVTFVMPVGSILLRSVYDPDVATTLPNVSRSIASWDGTGLPDNEVALDLVSDLAIAAKEGAIGVVAKRLNLSTPGFRTLILKTGNRLQEASNSSIPSFRQLTDIDARWQQPETWQYLKQATQRWTTFYLLRSLDFNISSQGVTTRDPNGIYVPLLLRTLEISGFVTLYCAILGFPLAYLLTSVDQKTSRRLMLLIMLPFWTSVLVRTTAWIVLLQDSGLVNMIGLHLGLWSQPLALIRNRIGVYIAMVHILLPFMVLPLYSVMAGIDRSQMRAASSLGAKPVRAFLTVFLPQAAPGLVAGSLIVFILALGYYVTPTLVGGAGDQMISYYIADSATANLNWGMAAALSLVLLIAVAILFAFYHAASSKSNFRIGR